MNLELLLPTLLVIVHACTPSLTHGGREFPTVVLV